MKKLLFLFVALVFSLQAMAKEPLLPLCQAFDGRYNNSKGVEIYEVQQDNNYYYALKVLGNNEISKQIVEWAQQTSAKAHTVSTSIKNGEKTVILIISSVVEPDVDVNVGITTNGANNDVKIWMQSIVPFMRTR